MNASFCSDNDDSDDASSSDEDLSSNNPSSCIAVDTSSSSSSNDSYFDQSAAEHVVVVSDGYDESGDSSDYYHSGDNDSDLSDDFDFDSDSNLDDKENSNLDFADNDDEVDGDDDDSIFDSIPDVTTAVNLNSNLKPQPSSSVSFPIESYSERIKKYPKKHQQDKKILYWVLGFYVDQGKGPPSHYGCSLQQWGHFVPSLQEQQLFSQEGSSNCLINRAKYVFFFFLLFFFFSLLPTNLI